MGDSEGAVRFFLGLLRGNSDLRPVGSDSIVLDDFRQAFQAGPFDLCVLRRSSLNFRCLFLLNLITSLRAFRYLSTYAPGRTQRPGLGD